MPTEHQEITRMLMEARDGHSESMQRLVEVVYPELRRLAESYMRRELPSHTLQPTALVNEAFLRLSGQSIDWQNRGHFFGIVARLMRQVLVEHARGRSCWKRGGREQRAELTDSVPAPGMEPDEVLAVDQALELLATVDLRQSRIVELRYFAGLTTAEIAETLSISEKTVKREWALARVWLHRRIFAEKDVPV